MTDKNFQAILAKNDIARELRRIKPEQLVADLHSNMIVEALKDIEKYIGEGNQPCVDDILSSNHYL